MVDISIEIKCTCGNILDAEVKNDRFGVQYVIVEPCERCLEEEYNKGKGEGEHS